VLLALAVNRQHAHCRLSRGPPFIGAAGRAYKRKSCDEGGVGAA